MATATISHVFLPVSLAQSLRRGVATCRTQTVEYARALLSSGSNANALRSNLLAQAITIENLRASAVFEDPDIQDRNDLLRRLDVALLEVIDAAQLLGLWVEPFRNLTISCLVRRVSELSLANGPHSRLEFNQDPARCHGR